MKILAVDDDASILELLPLVARNLGYSDLTPVPSGEMALDAIGRSVDAFECFLLDINMPGMNGIELCALIRSMPAHQRTPIIMLTAMSERDYIDRAFKAGATDYATKPFDFIELGARLRAAEQLLQARRQSDDAVRTARSGDGLLNGRADGGSADVTGLRSTPSLIEHDALVNYLAQLSRAGLSASQVLALCSGDLSARHEGVTPDERAYVLSEVANAIDAALLTSPYVMAHAGQGVFVIVSNSATTLDPLALEAEIQGALDEKDIEFDDGMPADVEVFVGSPARLECTSPETIGMIIERAVARAENRRASRKAEPRPPNVRAVLVP